jgi:putative Ca2+/H+ antiporter (TMEM165/GDT1 family)
MKGLEIIERIAIEQTPDWVVICIVLGTFSILIPTVVVYSFTKNFSKSLVAEVISGAIYIAFALIVLVNGVFDKPTGEYQYEVKITEDVGYIEFTDKYDVVKENDDGTYIVQEKNIEE